MAQLIDREKGEEILIPCNMMRSGEEVFLDDMTRDEAEKALHCPIHIVKSSGRDLLDSILGIALEE